MNRSMNVNAYRANARAPAENTPTDIVVHGEYINGGKIARAPRGAHVCRVPGFWSRLWNRIGYGDRWSCPCGDEWVWCRNDSDEVGYKGHPLSLAYWANHQKKLCRR